MSTFASFAFYRRQNIYHFQRTNTQDVLGRWLKKMWRKTTSLLIPIKICTRIARSSHKWNKIEKSSWWKKLRRKLKDQHFFQVDLFVYFSTYRQRQASLLFCCYFTTEMNETINLRYHQFNETHNFPSLTMDYTINATMFFSFFLWLISVK